MFYATTENGERISAELAVEKGIRNGLRCPSCKALVVLRNGTQRVCHFAHRKGADCDSFTADMSEWHLEWQKHFPKIVERLCWRGKTN